MMFQRPDKFKNLINIAKSELDTPIYRIFSFKRLLEMYSTGKLTLVHCSKWDDPFENFLLKCTVRHEDGTLAGLRPLFDRWHGQCWTTNPESDAMWRIYSTSEDGVRVSTTIGKLFSVIYQESNDLAHLQSFLGRVEYRERAEIEQWLQDVKFGELLMSAGGRANIFAELLCVKRTAFSHEEEIRILGCKSDNDANPHGLMEFNINPNDTFTDVLFDPRLTKEKFEILREQTRANGCDLPISLSDLYTLSPIVISM
jgi:hypothetical protein